MECTSLHAAHCVLFLKKKLATQAYLADRRLSVIGLRVRQRNSLAPAAHDAVAVADPVVLHPRHDGVPVLALVLESPARAGHLAVLVPLERDVGVAHEPLPHVVPAVVEVLERRLVGALVGVVVQELVEGVLGGVLSTPHRPARGPNALVSERANPFRALGGQGVGKAHETVQLVGHGHPGRVRRQASIQAWQLRKRGLVVDQDLAPADFLGDESNVSASFGTYISETFVEGLERFVLDHAKYQNRGS